MDTITFSPKVEEQAHMVTPQSQFVEAMKAYYEIRNMSFDNKKLKQQATNQWLKKTLDLDTHSYFCVYHVASAFSENPICHNWILAHALDEDIDKHLQNDLISFKGLKDLALLLSNSAFWDVEHNETTRSFTSFFAPITHFSIKFIFGSYEKAAAFQFHAFVLLAEQNKMTDLAASLIMENRRKDDLTTITKELQEPLFKEIIQWYKTKNNLEGVPDEWVMKALGVKEK